MRSEATFEAEMEAGRVNLAKKSQKTKEAIFDLYSGQGATSLASEAGHFSNLKIVPVLASVDGF